MKALIKKYAKRGLWLGDVDMPTPGIDDVLIKIQRTAICGTDVHIYNWDEWAQKTIPVPMHVGHEFSGEIIEIGSAETCKQAFIAERDNPSGKFKSLAVYRKPPYWKRVDLASAPKPKKAARSKAKN